MEDKTFELLTKMYSDFSERFDKVESRLDKLETGQKKIETTLENDINNKLQALHEREAINSNKLDDHSKQLAIMNNKFDYLALSINSQDKRLEVVESSRRKKAK